MPGIQYCERGLLSTTCKHHVNLIQFAIVINAGQFPVSWNSGHGLHVASILECIQYAFPNLSVVLTSTWHSESRYGTSNRTRTSHAFENIKEQPRQIKKSSSHICNLIRIQVNLSNSYMSWCTVKMTNTDTEWPRSMRYANEQIEMFQEQSRTPYNTLYSRRH